MASVYEISAALHLQNKISPALLGIIKDVDLLKGKIGEVNKSLIALGGALSVAGGVGIFAGLKYAVDKAKELNHELVQIQKLGLTAPQYDQAKAAIYGLHAQVPGTTSADAAKIYGQIYSPLGHENAIKMMKPLAQFVQVLGAQTGDYKGAVDKVYNMVRAGDLMGKFMNNVTHQVDVTKLEKFLDLGARVITATHGKVSADTWFGLAQQGGPAMSGMTDEGMLTMAMISQAMGGQRAGTALSSIFQQLRGGTMTQYRAEQFRKWGFVGDYSIGKGGHLIWDKGALDPETHPALQALKDDPLKFSKMLIEKLIEEKGKDTDKQIPMLYQLFQRQTSIREMHDMIRNMSQLEQERPRIAAGLGISASSNLANTKDYTQVMHNFTAAWDEFMAHLGTPVLEGMAIPALKSMTKALDGFTEWAKKNQEAIFLISKGLAALGAALIVLGSAAIIAALAPMVGVGGLIAGLATAIGLLVGLNWGAVGTGFNAIREAIEGFAKWLHDIGQKIYDWVKSLNPFSHTSFGGGGFGGGGGLINASYGGAAGGGSYNVSKAYDLIKQAGGTDEEARTLAAISQAESAGNPLSHNTKGLDNSYGLWQINMLGGMGPQRRRQFGLGSNEDLYDPTTNARVALQMHRRAGGYRDWSTYSSGAYRKYMSNSPHVPSYKGGGQTAQDIHVHTHLDGQVLANNTVRQILKSSEHSRQAAYFDSYGHYAGPDRQVATA
jgi:hypothetical protein